MNDSISRQAVIDAIVAWTVQDIPDVEMPTDLIDRINALPSADVQPVLQCKEGTMKPDTIKWIEVHGHYENERHMINADYICEMHSERTTSGEIFTWIKLVSGEDYFVVESLEEIIGAIS